MATKNRDMLRTILVATWPDGCGPDLCEWDPGRAAPARLKDPFHGLASEPAVALLDGRPCHVCTGCVETAGSKLLMRVARRAAA